MLPLFRHLHAGASWGPFPWSDLSMMVVPVQGKVGPSYKRMAMAHNVNSRRYTDLLIPLAPVQGKVGPSYFIQMHCHGTPCKQQEVYTDLLIPAHTPPYTHGHTMSTAGGTQTSSYPCAYMACTPGSTHTSLRITYIWVVHQEVYTHFLIHMDEHTWLKYACTMQKPPNTHQHTQTSLYAKLIK